jgi:replicative superfamily II helicase
MLDDFTEALVIAAADVLQHADGDEHIVVARDVSVVILDELYLILQAFLCGA